MPPPPPSVQGARPFVGREAQVAILRSLVDGLAAPHGALVLLTGEPGMGKTRLAEVAVETARAQGVRTAWATSWQGEGAPPLWPWVQILRQLAGSEQTLDRFVTAAPGESPAARFAQCEAVAQVLRESAAGGAVAVVLEDLQWADPATIRVLAFVTEATRNCGCLLLGTYRPEELAVDHAAELARVGSTVAVPRLEPAEAAALLHASAGTDVTPKATAAVVERSGGNPLFVWEFGQLMAQAGRTDVAPAAVPGAVAAVIDRRLARLPEDSVATLRTAAMAGNSFSAEVVARIGGIDLDRAQTDIEAATDVGLLTRLRDVDAIAFSHDLVRDVVLDGIDPARRAELHLHAAGVLEDLLDEDASYHAAVADHLSRAGPGHERRASGHWEMAAVRASDMLAFDEAATFFARAGLTAGTDRFRRASLLVDEGDALLLAGDLTGARARFARGADEARAARSPELLARAVLGMGAGPVAWEVPIGSSDQAALVADALAALPDAATELRSMLLARLSVTAATPETLDESKAQAREALALADASGDAELVGQALAAVNDAFGGPAHAVMRLENADAIVELAVGAGDRVLEVLGYRFRIVADLEVGDIAAVDHDIAAFARLAGLLRHPLVSWYVPLFRGMRALLNGDVDTADGWCRDVQAAALTTGSQNAEMLARSLELGIDLARGRRPNAEAFDALFDVDPADWASYAAGLALVKLHAGDGDGARHILRLHASNGFARLGDDGEHLVTLTFFGRVAAASDDAHACELVYDLLLPHAGLWGVDGIAACCWAPVELELGRLALALGRRGDAAVHLARARAEIMRIGAPLILRDVEDLEAQCSDRAEPTPSRGAVGSNEFRREGQFWTVAYGGRTVRMKDAKGLRDLARLLASPGAEVHVLDLAAAAAGAGAASRSADMGELLDARARAEYRRRIVELDDDIADAEACADIARADRARAERDFIAAELRGALGLAGKPRKAGDPAERARKAVTGRIRLTIGRIGSDHPELARHLDNAVRTGTFCSYRPAEEVVWTT